MQAENSEVLPFELVAVAVTKRTGVVVASGTWNGTAQLASVVTLDDPLTAQAQRHLDIDVDSGARLDGSDRAPARSGRVERRTQFSEMRRLATWSCTCQRLALVLVNGGAT